MRSFHAALAVGIFAAGAAPQAQPALSVDQILQAYTTALGGQAAIARITSRESVAKEGHLSSFKLYWQAPDLVLRIQGKEKEGFDGHTGWVESKRKKITKLPVAQKDQLETDANPIRFVHLRDLYHDLAVDKAALRDGVEMDVITSPNAIGETKFFFSHADHLLYRIEDLGTLSAYYKHITEFQEYRAFDGILIPTRISRQSDEPGADNGEIRLTKIVQNSPDIQTYMFRKPDVGKVITAAKH